MEWLDSYKFKPKHGTQIFIWDIKNQRPMLLNALWDESDWKPNPNFPIWKYCIEGFEPIPLNKNKEDAIV